MLHHRRSIRLPGYDYSQPGEYFITMVAYHRESIFGVIDGDRVRLSPFGQIAREEWLKTPSLRPEIELGEFVVMPNHFHAIAHILDSEPNDKSIGQPVGAYGHTPQQDDALIKTPFHSPSRTIGALVRGYKGIVTKRINDLRGTPSTPVWQRNYYEEVITTDDEYLTIAAYIESNPANWENDKEYMVS